MKHDRNDSRLTLGWDKNLADVIDDWRFRQFNWGENNCLSFGTAVQQALFDNDSLSELNIEFSPDDEDNKRRCQLKMTRLLNEYGVTAPYQIVDRFLRRSDAWGSFYKVHLVGRIFDKDEMLLQGAIGVRIENRVIFMSEDGLVEDPLKRSDILWDDPCALPPLH